MPIYEYHCKKCGKDSEILARSAAGAKAKCPACGSAQLVRKLSVFATARRAEAGDDLPACSGDPSSCGRCGDDFDDD